MHPHNSPSMPPRAAGSIDYITRLRFPLAALVVLIHSYNSSWRSPGHEAMEGTAALLANVLPTFAVPLFFVLSGYLFFRTMPQFSWPAYGQKLRRRALTLLLPYVVWNAIAYILYVGQSKLSGTAAPSLSANLLWGSTPMGADGVNWLGWHVWSSTAPVHEPLWFVRDLILLNLLAPLVYAVLRRLRLGGLILFAAVYYGSLWPNWGGVTFMGFWFFALGAYFALGGKSLVQATRPALKPSLALIAPLLLLLALFQGSGEWFWQPSLSLYVLAAIVCALHLANVAGNALSRWAGSSFFVYASHVIVMLPVSRLAAKVVAGHGFAVQLLGFLACPVVTIAVCCAAYALLRRFAPHLSGCLTGQYR